MYLLLSAAAVTVCFIVIESKERTASLVVLPPLVIGYDELYHDSQGDGKHLAEQVEQVVKGNEKVKEGIDDKNLQEEIIPTELGKLIEDSKTAIDSKTKQKDILRDTIIDVKGRRHNYRSAQRRRRRQKIEYTD